MVSHNTLWKIKRKNKHNCQTRYGMLDFAKKMNNQLCISCAASVSNLRRCFACHSVADDVSPRSCIANVACSHEVLLYDMCMSAVDVIGCDMCWAGHWHHQCCHCKAMPYQRGRYGKLCHACYNHDNTKGDDSRCMYCRTHGSDVAKRLCTWMGKSCQRKIITCDRCANQHDKVIYSKC